MNARWMLVILLTAMAAAAGSALASTRCEGGATDGADVYGEWEITQDECNNADELFCQSFNEDVDIIGHFITISKFDDSRCTRPSDREINIKAEDGTVPNGESVTVKVTQYLDSEDDVCDNTMGMRHVQWECDGSRAARANSNGLPSHRWRIERPVPDQNAPYRHRLMILNDEDIDTNGMRDADLAITNLVTVTTNSALHVISNGFSTNGGGTNGFFLVWRGVRNINFDGRGSPHGDMTLASGQRWTIDLLTQTPMYDGYIYLRFEIVDPLDPMRTLATVWGGHHVLPQAVPVFGDSDDDGDVDLVDFAAFNLDFTGPLTLPLVVTATDNLVPAGPLSGVQISGTPSGITDFSAPMDYDAQVSMTAPAHFVGPGAMPYDFDRWHLNGVPMTQGVRTLNFRINIPATANASYMQGPTR